MPESLAAAWTPDTQICTRVILGLIIPGVGLTLVLLALCGYAAWNPVSRPYLDRVSFRLLIYALVAHLVFAIAFTIGSLTAEPGMACDLLSFFTNLGLLFSGGIFFCMALNLPLVLAHNVNGQKMEKYYVLGTALVCLICNLVPYVSHKLGYSTNDTCWYRETNPHDMMRWLIGTQTAWVIIFAAGEVIAFLIIVGYLVVYELDVRRLHVDAQFKSTYSSEASRRPGSTIRMFRNIILRIGLYPLVSCVLNLSTSVLDLYVMKHTESTKLIWRLNLADLAIYAGRPLIYGLLAATDPSFIRALRALYRSEDVSKTPTVLSLSTVIEMQTYESDLDKDDAWGGGYGDGAHVHVQIRAGESSTSVSSRSVADLEAGEDKDRCLDEGDARHGVATNVPAPMQPPPPIDVVCHI
ncbi:hypothetical protein MVEN_02225900 [Mycena venus]|uniref:G-protein coupled receptors family 2 profile 2 domain-containing protein n=1 Tax=Mycena venus TaxID=2733690 RepID=A0A8H6X818_9AGAR|nr:hypothetical protein MVEN_02225900 [Mycena venus]